MTYSHHITNFFLHFSCNLIFQIKSRHSTIYKIVVWIIIYLLAIRDSYWMYCKFFLDCLCNSFSSQSETLPIYWIKSNSQKSGVWRWHEINSNTSLSKCFWNGLMLTKPQTLNKKLKSKHYSEVRSQDSRIIWKKESSNSTIWKDWFEIMMNFNML